MEETNKPQIERSKREFAEEELLQYLTDFVKEIDKDGTKIISLIGGPASGKSTLATKLAAALGDRVAVLSTDNYLKGDRAWRRANVEECGRDPLLKYDPEFLNKQIRAITELQDGQELGIPSYDGQTGIAISEDPTHIPDHSIYATKIKGRQDFIIVEGDFQFLSPEFMDRLVYLDVPDNIRLENRLHRDSQHRRESTEDAENIRKIVANFNARQKSQFEPHTLPQKQNADLVISVHAQPLNDRIDDSRFTYSYSVDNKV